jgi:spore coat protein H
VRDPARYTEEYGLPVFFVDPLPNEKVYGEANISYGGRTYHAKAKLRGSSSLNYPKRSYTLKFDKDDRFSAADLGMGFVARRKLVLTSTFDDNTYLRQRLGFELWDRMDPEHIQVLSANAVLYVNGVYHGLYTVTDHVDRHSLEGQGFLESGNLYKAVGYDADFRLQDPLHAGLRKNEGLPEADYSDLEALVRFVDAASDEEFRRDLTRYLDLRDYRDWWVFITILRGDDTANKNSYHYFESPGEPARYVPWDLNATFGQNWATFRQPAHQSRNYDGLNRLFERLLADPEQARLLEERRRAALDGVFHPDRVDSLIDGYLREIEASARRDFRKWEPAYRSFGRWKGRSDFTTFEGEVAYLRSWYRAHWLALRHGTAEVVDAKPVSSAAALPAGGPAESGSSESSADQAE